MESKKRSIIKSLSYRFYSASITFICVFVATGSLSSMFKIGSIIEIAKLLLYYLHERAWSYLRLGLIHPQGKTIWFTGLSGSGKSTIADVLAQQLTKKGYPVQILDGDKIRNTINKGLGFSPEDRERNIFNIAHIAKLLNEAGVIVLVPVISPYKSLRTLAREVIDNFTGVYVKCPITVCEDRDPKGIYKRVRAGEIKMFTGISDPYEAPDDFEITIETYKESVNQCVAKIIAEASL